MQNFYIIAKKDTNLTSIELLKKSAEERGIRFVIIYTEDYDFTNQVKLTANDALFKVSTDPESTIIEKTLINSKVNSFYSSYLHCLGKRENVIDASLVHEKLNLPIIPTVFSLPQNKAQQEKYTQYLGGYPVILKVMGGMHGVGIIKIDSPDSLSSVLDYFRTKNETVVLRKFIKHQEQARLIVLGDQVVAHHTNLVSHDFRTNAGENSLRQRTVKDYDQEIKNIAIKAVNSLGYEFGGVDILIEEGTGKPYIAEVNFPCFFPKTQQLTGIDISGKMIDYLINKSKSLKG